jgi:diacylglycerol O-acyltransferase
MRQLSALDAQFLNVESPTTVGHVGSLVLLDPSTAPDGRWDLEHVRAVFEPRLHLAAPLRQRLVEVPLGLGRPYWVDDPHFDIEFHLRELALPGPGTREQLGEQVARIHARQLDRSRPLWEAYVITGLEGGRGAFYTKIHHAAIDGISGAEILETIMDLSAEPREVPPEDAPFVPRPMPSVLNLIGRGVGELALNPLDVLATVPRSLPYVDRLPGAANVPGTRLFSESAALVGMALGGAARRVPRARELRAPRTPLNGTITAHRRFAFGSLPLSDVKLVKNHFAMTVNDVVMALTAAALRRWLLDHDALPGSPLVGAVPVSIRTEDRSGVMGNQISVMLAELPTHIRDPRERLEFTRESMLEAKRSFDAVPASLLQDLSALVPTALSGLAARALFKLATVPGVPFNLFVSNIPGPQLPLYVAGARVEGVHPVSAVTDMTGGLNITLFSYDGALDFGLIACREMVPDVWHLIGYLQDAMAEMVALVSDGGDSGDSAAGAARAPGRGGGPAAGAATKRTGPAGAGTKRTAARGSRARSAAASTTDEPPGNGRRRTAKTSATPSSGRTAAEPSESHSVSRSAGKVSGARTSTVKTSRAAKSSATKASRVAKSSATTASRVAKSSATTASQGARSPATKASRVAKSSATTASRVAKSSATTASQGARSPATAASRVAKSSAATPRARKGSPAKARAAEVPSSQGPRAASKRSRRPSASPVAEPGTTSEAEASSDQSNPTPGSLS